MKLTDLRLISGCSLGLFASLALTAAAFAGPGPQAANQTRGSAAPAPIQAPAAVAPAMACPAGQNHLVSEFRATNAGGKWAPHSAAVGVTHDCANCGGAIAAVQGRTADATTKDCAVCARSMPACCTAKG